MSYIKDKYIDLQREYKELKENMDAIYNEIAELYDLIDDENIEKYEILEKLASIQSLTK